MLIGAYVGFKFGNDLLNNLREIPYAALGAAAEIGIASDVYDHVQRLSLAFHLSRETGKLVRLVSRGSQSFNQVLRMLLFNLLSILLEIGMVLVIYGVLFSWEFLVL